MILDQKAPLVAPRQPPVCSRPSFTLSFLAPVCCFSSSPSNHPLLLYSGDSGSFLMSSEMWSRDHSETGRHRPPPNSHHSSIIYTLVFISGMTTFILKPASLFMFRNGVRLHLFWQKASVLPAWLRNFLYIEDRCIEVKTGSCCSHDGWATSEPGNDSFTTGQRVAVVKAECCPDFDLQIMVKMCFCSKTQWFHHNLYRCPVVGKTL